MSEKQSRVVAVGPMPPEKSAYALARYSRSPDSIRQSLDWVQTHDSQKFLESFYFQYGHASIADLGHVVLCFEGISELVAIEVEDEPLWDGQARSSRYQDFSRSGFVTPPGLDAEQTRLYEDTANQLLAAYKDIHSRIVAHLSERLPKPGEMKPDAYQRNISARAFDVARYLLFWGIRTGVGQVTSIRTLERQIRRLKASEYEEARLLAGEIAEACANQPECFLDRATRPEPVAPTLARHVDADMHVMQSREDLRQWASQNLPPARGYELTKRGCAPDWGQKDAAAFRCRTAEESGIVDLLIPTSTSADIVATLLYPVTDRPYRELYELASDWSAAMRTEVLDTAVRSRTQRDELLRGFRGGPYVFDIVMDLGAYRDMHRHRRCQQFRQSFGTTLGFDTPEAITEAGLTVPYKAAIQTAFSATGALPEPASHYLLPFATRSRFLFKMDFAEAEYIARQRSGVKGHFSYRRVAWEMKRKMEEVEPELGRLIHATPPWVEDPLKR